MRTFPVGTRIRVDMASGKAHEGVVQGFEDGKVELADGHGTFRIYLRWVEAIFPV